MTGSSVYYRNIVCLKKLTRQVIYLNMFNSAKNCKVVHLNCEFGNWSASDQIKFKYVSFLLHSWKLLGCLGGISLFSSPEPKARVSYCHSRRRRPSVRKLFTFSTSSPEPLDRFWWNLVGMKYSWSLTSVVVFRPDPPRGGSRAGPK